MAIFPARKILAQKGDKFVARSLSKTDASAFCHFFPEIAKESFHTMHYVGGKLGGIEEQELRITFAEEDSLRLMLGVFDGEDLIGFLHCRPLWKEHPWVRHIAEFGMMIRKSHWGLGIGKIMLAIQDQHAKDSGFTRIQAHVRVNNERGVKLYETAGFQIEGIRKQAAKIEGKFVDEYYIAKLF